MNALDKLFRNGPIPVDEWGKDHKTTLLYAETRAVDHNGRLDRNHMRESSQYPTRLAGGKELRGHTDYDCLRDAQAAGFGVLSDDESTFDFYDAGWAYVHGLRKERALRGLAERERQRREGRETRRARAMNEGTLKRQAI